MGSQLEWRGMNLRDVSVQSAVTEISARMHKGKESNLDFGHGFMRILGEV